MENTKFWRLESPDYESDYDYTYINGNVEHPYGMPGVRCNICGQVWGGSRMLPYSCPVKIRNHKNLNERWPIPSDEHNILKRHVIDAFAEDGISVGKLYPGDTFQPAFMDVPSRPHADFLWGVIGSVIVSHKIKDAFIKNNVKGCSFCQVELRSIGKEKPILPAPVPSSGEPEDIYDEVEYLKDTINIEPYYEMVITAESKRPPGADIISVCRSCGREEYDNNLRLLVMKPDMWLGDDIFLLSTTLWIIVTDKVKNIIESSNLTNYTFKEMIF